MIPGAVVAGELEEILELVEVVGAESRVISLAYCSHMEVTTTTTSKSEAKTGLLSFSELLIVVKFIVLR